MKDGFVNRIRKWARTTVLVRGIWGRIRWYSTHQGQEQILLWVLHLGWRVKCPICGWQGRSFYPNPPRLRQGSPNAVCRRCSAHARHRLLLLYLQQCTDLFARRLRVLEIAPGPYSSRIFGRVPQIQYTTVDLQSPYAVCRSDMTALPFCTESFDLIICYHVLEHIVDDRLAMVEMHRVLDRKGQAIVQVPWDLSRRVSYEDASLTSPTERLHAFGQEDHVRIYGYDFLLRMNQAGFDVRVCNFAARQNQFHVERFGLDREEVIFVCTKAGSSQ